MAAGPHNRAVPCPLCHEKFFPKSLPFHQKQCEKRLAAQRVNCPYCSTEVSGLELPSHVSVCPRAKRPGQGRGGGGGGGGQRGGRGGGPVDDRQAAAGQFDAQVTEDGRMSCVHCGRFFNPDRIDKHQSICGNLKSARPKGVDGQPTQQEAKVFDSTAQRTGQGNAFCSVDQYKRRQEERARDLERTKASKARTQGGWRRQHEEFQAACKAGRGDDMAATMPSPGPKPGMVTCQYCSRQFDRAAADRHIPICAKVQNRPKPPPTPSRAQGQNVPPPPPPYGSWQGGQPGQSSRSPAHKRIDDYREQPEGAARSGRLPPNGAGAGTGSPMRGGGRREGSGGGGRGMGSTGDSFRPPTNGGTAGRRTSASEGALPRIPPGAGRRGLSASAGARQPSSRDDEDTEGSARLGGGRRNFAASADDLRQPMDSNGRRQPADGATPGSAGSRSSASSGGAGLHAARSLRQNQRRPPGGEPGAAPRPARVEEGGPPDDFDYDDSDATWRPDLDITAKQLDMTSRGVDDEDSRLPSREDSGSPARAADARPSATQRIGLRRTALLYRLLSQVPSDALRRELDSCGVDSASLDTEGMIEAIAEQLS